MKLLPRIAVAVTIGASILLLPGLSSAQDKTFTISWWGYNGEKLQANIIEPFKKICNCEVAFETGNNADRLNKLQIRNGEGVDVAFFTDAYSQIGIEKDVFQKLDRSKLSNLNELYEIAQAPQGDYGAAYSVGRVGIVYDSAKVKPITKWADLWREDLKGQITLPGITTTAGPMVVMKAGEYAGTDAFENADPAFEAIDKIKPNVVKNYKTGSEMVNLISTGEASVAIAQDFALKSLQDAVPTMVWADLEDGSIATLNTINIAKGSKQVDLAHQFIDFVLSKDVQQVEAEQGVDAPVNAKVELTPEQAKLWTYGKEMIDSLSRVDYVKLNAAKTDWIDRWNEIFGA